VKKFQIAKEAMLRDRVHRGGQVYYDSTSELSANLLAAGCAHLLH
jgi:hypothetical protein